MASLLNLATVYLLIIKALMITCETRTGEEYRLPDIYVPILYQIDITVTSEVFTEISNEFSGRVEIQFSTTSTTNSVALHAHHDFITINRITFDNVEVSNEDYSLHDVTDILTVTTNEIISNETYTLAIEYTGILSTSDMFGFYKSSYVDVNGETKYLATTFFSPVHARKAFPCFDEPSMKAVFQMSLTVPDNLNVFFNTPQSSDSTNSTTGLKTVVFDPTPKMSTFILAFIVSEFTCTSGDSIDTVIYQVCSRNGTVATREVALEFAPLLLANLNNYTNYGYGNVSQKLDQVAIPDFAANAMENWGLITYRETALLWDQNESSNSYRQQVITVMAHEIAHQWFGNLVSPKWWSAVFLKEGFATYFQYHTPHEILPDWELDKQYVLERQHAALLSDALENAHALESECNTPAEISAKFSTISYSKGASILRMVQHFMGKDRFRTGLQNYIELNQFGNVDPEDIWIALSDSVLPSISYLPDNLTTVMETWIKEPGYPVLYVSLNGNDVTISQQRFLFSGEDTTTKWYVPISYSLSLDPDKFGRTSPILWLTPDDSETFTLPLNCSWIILNNQQSAYYRANYDDALWNNIAAALLQDNFDGIGDLNRAQIVDDIFNLARANYLKYSRVLSVINFLSQDTSYFSWYSALTGFDFLLTRVGQDSLLGQYISDTILRLMSRLYSSVPISTLNEDDQIYTLKQVLANTWACRLGNQDCIQQVQTLFNEYKSSGTRPNKNLRRIVYCTALTYSSDASNWEFLWEAYTASDLATEKVTILSALGCTTDESLLVGYLNKTIFDGSGIRSQDSLSVFSSVYSGSSKGVDVAFDFLLQNYELIAERYSGLSTLGNLIRGIAARFTTEAQVSKLRNFIQTGNLPEAFQLAANQALEVAESNLKWLENFESDLLDYYRGGGSRIVGASFWIIGALVIILSNYV